MALKETWSEASYRRALLWLVLTISLAVREVLHRQRGRFLPLGKTGQELPRIGVQRGQRPICPLVQALSGKGLAPSAQDARADSADPASARGAKYPPPAAEHPHQATRNPTQKEKT